MESELIKTACCKKIENITGLLFYLDFVTGTHEKENRISLITKQIFVELKSYEYSTKTRHEVKEDKFLYNYVVNGLYNQHLIDVEMDIYNTYKDFAHQSKEKFLTKRQLFFKKWFKKINFPKYIKDEKDLFRNISLFSSIIAANSRMGSANFIIVNQRIFSFLLENTSFVFNSIDTVKTIGDIVYEGNLNGLKVFVNYNQGDEIIFGRDTKDTQNGVYYVEKDSSIANSTYLITESENFAPLINVVHKRKIISTPNAHNNFISCDIIFGKKPLWRKLLKI